MVQLPQGPLLLLMVLLKYLCGFRLILDVHSGFLIYDSWRGVLLNGPFRNLLRFGDYILVHNRYILHILPDGCRDKAYIIYDPVYVIRPKIYSSSLGDYNLVIIYCWLLHSPMMRGWIYY